MPPTPAPAPRLIYRFAVPADAADIVALVQSAYRGEASRAGWTTEADLLDGIRIDEAGVLEIIASELSVILVAVAEPVAGESVGGTPGVQILACCQLRRSGPDLAYFGLFAIRPESQAGGMGRAVLAEAEAYAASTWQCRTLEMTVIAQREELITWYERRGYTRGAETRPFPYGDERFGRPKRDDLYFVVLDKILDKTPDETAGLTLDKTLDTA